MQHPAFFNEVRSITLYDPLAALLGAAEGGIIEYCYGDAVKFAGHSCPTVAGIYLATSKALERLYPDSGALPERGAIKVAFREHVTSGVTGVMSNIVSLITGATQGSGFKGIGGKFDRRNLLLFNAAIGGEMRFERTDNGAAVLVAYHPELVPPDPALKELMPLVLSGAASDEEKKEFGRLWQDRVKRILIDQADDPGLVVLS
ncbi:MAG: FmdE family protein [Sulfuricellaceae bacterium]